MSGAGVFVSWRHDDTKGLSLALRDRLVESLGPERIFLDCTDLRPADPFGDVIVQRLRACDVLVVLIDRRWDPGRLHRPDDWVRFEIATALQQGKPLIPVLVDGTPMPAADTLPPELRPLAGLQAFELRTPRLDADVWDLAGRATLLAGGAWPPPEPGLQAYGVVAVLYTLFGGLLLLVLTLAILIGEPHTGWLKLAWAGIAVAMVLVLRLPVIEALRSLSRTQALEAGGIAHGLASAAYALNDGIDADALIAFTIFGLMPAAILYFTAGATRRLVRR